MVLHSNVLTYYIVARYAYLHTHGALQDDLHALLLIHAHTYIFTYLQIYIHVSIHSYTYIHIHTQRQPDRQTYKYSDLYVGNVILILTCTHTRLGTGMYTAHQQ